MALHVDGDGIMLPTETDHQQGMRMAQAERRTGTSKSGRELRTELNDAQLETLSELERFGWQLKFVRRPLFQPSVPVVFDGDRKHYAVLERDGTLNEHPAFTIRES
jgi:hypothetical protein